MKIDNKRKFSTLDAVLLLVIFTFVICITVRVFVGEEGIFKEDAQSPGEYTVTFEYKNGTGKFADYIKEGHDVFLVSGEIMGEAVSVSEKSAEVTVSGVMTESGFMLNESIYLAPNMDIRVRSFEKTVTVTVTDIIKNDTSDN